MAVVMMVAVMDDGPRGGEGAWGQEVEDFVGGGVVGGFCLLRAWCLGFRRLPVGKWTRGV